MFKSQQYLITNANSWNTRQPSMLHTSDARSKDESSQISASQILYKRSLGLLFIATL